MPRPPREELAGAIHHVFARGNAKGRIYLDDADRERYLAIFGRAVVRQRWRCLAYCLMDNHVHLLLETPTPNLGRGMQWAHGLYAQAFNRRHDRAGHVFQGRFGAVRVKSDAQLLLVARYIARNPVEGGLCGEPGDWPWSSHATAFDRAGPAWLDTPRLLDFFGASGGESRRRYADFVALR
jgi:REP element-mobilizing transposase RayT